MSLPLADECFGCGEQKRELLENHHVLGKNYALETVRLCKNCHFLVTKAQNTVSPRRRSKKAAKTDLEAFAFISIGALFSLMGEIFTEAGEIYYKNIKEG